MLTRGVWGVGGLFLFKQKTAYEMRISDWSSDVCSSDLLDAGGNPLLRTHTGIATGQIHGWWRDEQGRVFATSEVGPGLIAGRDLPAEIGRASCRERVCPYV